MPTVTSFRPPGDPPRRAAWAEPGAAASATGWAQAPLRVVSPDGRNEVTVGIHEGALYYGVARAGRKVILPSRLGFELRGARAMRDSLRIVGAAWSAYDTTWTQPWG